MKRRTRSPFVPTTACALQVAVWLPACTALAPLIELKLRDYGYKVEGGGASVKVRRKEGKISSRDEAGNAQLSTRSETSALALGIERWHLDESR